MRAVMSVERDSQVLRVRVMSHSLVFPITKIFWRVKQVLRDLETVAVEWSIAALTVVWTLCLLLPGPGPFEVGGRPYQTMADWGNEWGWGLLAAAQAGLTLIGSKWPVVGGAKPQVLAYLVGVVLYFGMAGAFGYQSLRLFSTWCALGIGVLCMFLCWRKASE